MGTSNEEIFRAIGSLTAEVTNLRRDIQESDRKAIESNRAADEHRAAVHKRVDDLVSEVGTLKTELSIMKEDVADSKAVTDEVRAWKQRGIGALFITGIGASALTFVITHWFNQLADFFRPH